MTLRELLDNMYSNPYDPATKQIVVRDEIYTEQEIESMDEGRIYIAIQRFNHISRRATFSQEGIRLHLFEKPQKVGSIFKLADDKNMNVLYHFLLKENDHNPLAAIRPPVVCVNDDERRNPRNNIGAYSPFLTLSGPHFSPDRSLDNPLHLVSMVNYTLHWWEY
jgi:hypothetical protein